MPRKTKLMLQVEQKYDGRPLERLIPEKVREHRNLQGVADEFGVTKTTLGFWVLKLGISIRASDFRTKANTDS